MNCWRLVSDLDAYVYPNTNSVVLVSVEKKTDKTKALAGKNREGSQYPTEISLADNEFRLSFSDDLTPKVQCDEFPKPDQWYEVKNFVHLRLPGRENNYLKDEVRAGAVYEDILEMLYSEEGEAAASQENDAVMAEAETRLAGLILDGEILDRDETAARHLLAEASEKLNTDAMILLGSLEEKEGNHIGAAAMYHKSAILGNAKGLIEFGRLLMNGTGVDKDISFARECFLKAAECGLGDAYYYLGQIEEKGLEGKSDKDKARKYYDKGTGLGSLMCRDADPELLGGTFPDNWGTGEKKEEKKEDYVFDFSGGSGNMRS